MDKTVIDANRSGVVPFLSLDNLRPPVVRPPQTGDTRQGAQQ
jgi:hypothetical protein